MHELIKKFVIKASTLTTMSIRDIIYSTAGPLNFVNV